MPEFNEIKDMLTDMRGKIVSSIAQGQKNTKEAKLDEGGDEGDQANQERAQELFRLFSKREQKKLTAIDGALDKINNQNYGVCDECGEDITMKRLKAIPFTRYCFDCQSSIEINYSSDNENEDDTHLNDNDYT